jgi:hypothetical protein
MTDGNGRGDFFAVDRESWAAVLGLGLNAAVVYLVLARGTGRDNSTTSWSVNAVEKYTAISRHRARAALHSLVQAGLIRWKTPGNRPRYDLGTANSGKPAWIWLPNALIDGANGNVAPPVELLRQTQDIAPLKLLVELYGAHDLESNGGVSWLNLYESYSRQKVGERGGYVIWEFWPDSSTTAFLDKLPAAAFMTGATEKVDGKSRDAGWSIFWPALKTLRSLGLLEFVPFLVESDSADAEIIMSLSLAAGTDAERRAASAAIWAAARLLGQSGDSIVERKGGMVIPLRRHQTKAQAVGICRLLYRPKTAATASWLARTAEWDEMVSQFDAIAPGFQMRMTG